MKNRKILCALIVLTGAISNNGKTDNTDRIVVDALLWGRDSNKTGVKTQEEMVELIHKEKFTISPNCASCQSPCGNTSDYDEKKFDATAKEFLDVKIQVYNALTDAVERHYGNEPESTHIELSDIAYRAISYIGYDMDMETYRKLLDDIEKEV